MATYIYETIPTKEGEAPERFEVRQSMSEDALTVHPETGVPVKRVITGGYGFVSAGRDSGQQVSKPAGGGHGCCGGGCGCSH